MPDDFDSLASRLVDRMLCDPRLDSFAQAVAGRVLDDPRLRQVVREVVLRVTEEQERQSGSAPVREFLRACELRGVSVELDRGLLLVTPLERLGHDLEAVLRSRREEITNYIRRGRSNP